MKKYTILSTLGDPTNITKLLSEKDIKHIQDGEDFIMYPTIVITNEKDDTFPQVQVLASMPLNIYTNTRVDNFWLSPFRNYKFQVSGTIDGRYTIGDSPVVGLGNIICADYHVQSDKGSMPSGSFTSNVNLDNSGYDGIAYTLLEALAKEALFSVVHRLDHGNPRRNHFDFTAGKLLFAFIELVVARLRGVRLIPGDPTFMELVENNDLFIYEIDDIDEFLNQQGAKLESLIPSDK